MKDLEDRFSKGRVEYGTQMVVSSIGRLEHG